MLAVLYSIVLHIKNASNHTYSYAIVFRQLKTPYKKSYSIRHSTQMIHSVEPLIIRILTQSYSDDQNSILQSTPYGVLYGVHESTFVTTL
jgi:hypothetical protein